MSQKDTNEIISVIAHELRSPLTSIKGYLTAIKDGVISPETTDEYINIMLAETDRTVNMLESLMQLAKFDSDAIKLNIEKFDINELIRIVVIEKINAIEDKCISVVTEFETDRLFVLADKNLIRHVISNLADNAIKYNRTGGKITFVTHVNGNTAEITVGDNGIGIAKEALPHIWNRFYQQDAASSHIYKGHGLGLAIVKEIIAAQNSTISVQSELDKGTLFTFPLNIYTE